ncbi:MAG TPA: hypothetical protein ENN32_08780 [Chloroflexi bacterium]|nr:hypothetical protein [Chloroflexota bacterium]
MSVKQVIDILISIGGLALAVTYVTGGLIVNLYLSRYGITQYQILKIKYLAVGLTYFTNFIAIILLSALPALFLLAASLLFQRIALIVSLLASVSLLLLWGRTTKVKSSFLSWQFWVVVGSLSLIFPLMIVARLFLILWFNGSVDYEFGFLIGLAFLAGVLSFVGQTYYYSRHLYGKQNMILGSVDPIGMGIPVEVQLTGKKDEISLLSQIGVPMLNSKTTERVMLFDETSTHYIIGISLNENDYKAAEVAKDLVKAIRYF